MRNKPSFKINMPEINIYILIIGIMSLILLFYNLYIGCLFFFGFYCTQSFIIGKGSLILERRIMEDRHSKFIFRYG